MYKIEDEITKNNHNIDNDIQDPDVSFYIKRLFANELDLYPFSEMIAEGSILNNDSSQLSSNINLNWEIVNESLGNTISNGIIDLNDESFKFSPQVPKLPGKYTLSVTAVKSSNIFSNTVKLPFFVREVPFRLFVTNIDIKNYSSTITIDAALEPISDFDADICKTNIQVSTYRHTNLHDYSIINCSPELRTITFTVNLDRSYRSSRDTSNGFGFYVVARLELDNIPSEPYKVNGVCYYVDRLLNTCYIFGPYPYPPYYL